MNRACGLGALLLAVVCGAGVAAVRADEARGRASSAASDVEDVLFLGPMRPLFLRLHVIVDGEPFRDVWMARFDELFALEDRQHDGRLTLDGARSVARDMNGSLRGGEALDLKSLADGKGRIERLGPAGGDRAQGCRTSLFAAARRSPATRRWRYFRCWTPTATTG